MAPKEEEEEEFYQNELVLRKRHPSLKTSRFLESWEGWAGSWRFPSTDTSWIQSTSI